MKLKKVIGVILAAVTVAAAAPVSGSSINHENLTDKEFTQKLAEDEGEC